jgi:hypothetical protein
MAEMSRKAYENIILSFTGTVLTYMGCWLFVYMLRCCLYPSNSSTFPDILRQNLKPAPDHSLYMFSVFWLFVYMFHINRTLRTNRTNCSQPLNICLVFSVFPVV